ncbi:MAG: CBS domain-containing protein [Gammaproteobacteria bacterium]|nr:CBS domain-containing protein [Gammaproteobacteria bacterium]
MTKRSITILSRDDFERALNEMDSFIDVSVKDLMDISEKAGLHAERRNIASIRIETLMSKPVVSVGLETPLAEAADLLVSKRISGLPVTDAQNKLAGVITEADFLRALGVPSHQPNHSIWQTLEMIFRHPPPAKGASEEIETLMTRNVITVSPEQTLNDALEAMKKHRIKRLVVTDAEDRVVGMITRSDLIRVFFARMKVEAELSAGR